MHKHIIVRQLIYSYKTFALFTRGLFKSKLAKQRMPKEAKSSTTKVRLICKEYPDEFSATPARDLRCNLCDVLVRDVAAAPQTPQLGGAQANFGGPS